MTRIEKGIIQRREALNVIGYQMGIGVLDITPENESLFQTTMSFLIEQVDLDNHKSYRGVFGNDRR